ncbi:hypothetical protein F5X99DRAFT_388792 [Biscogniauxia marginata]|nr:hypothetical protein F5X99DRAFT_388792 [Biscogniauxia marginata]
MEALGAAGSIVGIAAFGLKFASTLQNYIDAVADADESLGLVAFDVSTTAGVLKQLKDFIEEDETASRINEKTIATEEGRKQVILLASQCEKVYIRLLDIIAGVFGVARDGNDNVSLDALDLGSMKALKLGQKLKMPFKESRIKKHREELVLLRISLLLQLRVMELAKEKMMSASERQPTLGVTVDAIIQRRTSYIREIALSRKRAQQGKFEAKEKSAPSGDLVDETNEAHPRNPGPGPMNSRPWYLVPEDRPIHLRSSNNTAPLQSLVAENKNTLQPSSESLKSVQRDQQPSHAASALPAMSGAQPHPNIRSSDVKSEPSAQPKPSETDPAPVKSQGLAINHTETKNRSIVSSLFPSSLSWIPRLSLGWRKLTHDGESGELEVYIIDDVSSTPRRLLFGQQQLKNMLNRVTKGRRTSAGDEYLSLSPNQRLAIERATLEANRSGSRSKTCIAISPRGTFRPGDPALVVFFSVGEPVAPVYLRFAGRVFSFAFELCRTWENMEDLIQRALGDNEEVGIRVRRGEYDLITLENHVILPTVWNSTVEPGLTVLILIRTTPMGNLRSGVLEAGLVRYPGFPKPISRMDLRRRRRTPSPHRATAVRKHETPSLSEFYTSDLSSSSSGSLQSKMIGHIICCYPSRDGSESEAGSEGGEDGEGSDIIDFEAEQETSPLQVDDLLRKWTNALDTDPPRTDDDGQ